MWGALLGGGRGGGERANPFALLVTALLVPIAASLLQILSLPAAASSRPTVPARNDGTGEPHARALEKLEVHARRVAMDIRPAQAQAFIVNPLTGRRVSFASLFRTHPSTAERVARLRAQPEATTTSEAHWHRG